MLARVRSRRGDIRQALRARAVLDRLQVETPFNFPAPVGGLNGRDALDDMASDDAVQLVNWYPGFGKVTVRGGNADWATVGTDDSGFVAATGAVETLGQLELATGHKLIAAADGAIYDVTAGGAELDTPLASSKSNDRWQHATMNDVLGLVNGEDAPLTYDGTNIATMTVAAAMGEPSLDVTTLVGIAVHRQHSYFIRENDAGFWFSAVNALGGDLEYFPLGDIQGVGGHLVAIASWTRDGGAGGIDDLAVFLMSSGQAVLYSGSNPGEAEDWSLVGVFSIGRPLGRRCVVKIGGEAVVLTVDGFTQLSRVLPGGRSAPGVNISDKLGKFALDQIRASGDSFGWSVLHYPRIKALIVNHPGGGAFGQFAANIATGAWCMFRGQEASCWSLFGDRLFYGSTAGQVIEADTGVSDRGANIKALGQVAYSTMRRSGRNKQVNAARPLLEATGSVTCRVGMYADYGPTPQAVVTAQLGSQGTAGTKWNTKKWNTFKWAAGSSTVKGWIGHAASGVAISPSLEVDQQLDRISWSGLDVTHSPMGIY